MLSAKEELENVVEAILFVSGQGVDISDIAEKLEVEENDIKKAIQTLKDKKKNTGINILTYKNSVQLCSNPDYAEDIAVVLNPIREKQLTKATLETLAIIAYKQPITRLDIENIRGVNCDYAVQILMNFNLIEVVGRKDAVGKPLLLGTTDEFLKRFNLQNLEQLPDYDELIERIEVLHKEFNDGLYKSTEIIPEEELIMEDQKDISFETTFSEENVEKQTISNEHDIAIESEKENATLGTKNSENQSIVGDNDQELKEKLMSSFINDDENFYQKDSDLL